MLMLVQITLSYSEVIFPSLLRLHLIPLVASVHVKVVELKICSVQRFR